MLRRFLTAAVAGLLLAAVPGVALAGWEEPDLLGGSYSPTTSGSVAVAGDHVHMVWVTCNRHQVGSVWYRRSDNGGSTWSPTRTLYKSADGCKASRPSMAVSGNAVHVVMVLGGSAPLWYRRSLDGGETWKRAEELAPDVEGDFSFPQVAVEGRRVHVVYKPRDWDLPLMYLRSTDRGARWSVARSIAPVGHYVCCGDLAASGGAVHLIYRQQHSSTAPYYYRRSLDGGVNWPRRIRITPKGWYGEAAVAASGDQVHFVFESDGRLFHRGSSDGGGTWSSLTRLSDRNETGAVVGDVAALGNKVHVVWGFPWHSPSGLHYRVSNDSGVTWKRTRVLPGFYRGVPMVIDLGAGRRRVHVVYQTIVPIDEDRTDYYAYYQRQS